MSKRYECLDLGHTQDVIQVYLDRIPSDRKITFVATMGTNLMAITEQIRPDKEDYTDIARFNEQIAATRKGKSK